MSLLWTLGHQLLLPPYDVSDLLLCVLSTAECLLNCDAGYKFAVVHSHIPSD